ncbi:MAG: aminoglycoside phosphotransferase family protein [Ktedonobacteraceae bacterium]|nr:aminoglycoside phosphotransferase family protein [Ktedonobacteraceae bacterium]
MTNDDLDPHAILHVLGLTDATSVTPVHGGSDTAIWQVERGGSIYALRVFGEGRHDDCEREKLVMQATFAGGLPVSQVYAEGIWHEHPALLLSWLPGWPLADELRVRPWRAWKLGILFGHMQASIHALPAPGGLDEHPDTWIMWLGPDRPSLQKCLQVNPHRSDALLHLDYHPFNVLTNGKSITGVLDWRNACAGEPRADAARTGSILCIDYVGKPHLRDRVVRKVFELGWRRGYEQKGATLSNLSLYYLWAGAVMERDLASKRTPEELARIHHWTMKWKRDETCPEMDGDMFH